MVKKIQGIKAIKEIEKIITWDNMVKNQLANCLTILRMFLVIPISLLLFNENFAWAMWLFLIAALSDGLDGYVAKKFASVSKFGSIMDPVADKFLLVSSFVILTLLGEIPIWLCILVVVRDLSIIAAVVGYLLVSKNSSIKPSLISKINTLFQIILVLYLVVANHFDFISPLETVLIGLVASTTIISGLDYAVRWMRKAYDNLNQI